MCCLSFLTPYGVKLLQCLGSSEQYRGQLALFSLSGETSLETSLNHLEYSLSMFNVVSLAGTQYLHF